MARCDYNIRQQQVDNLRFTTVAEAEAAVFIAGQWCSVSDTNSIYYYDPSSSKARDGIYVLNTGGAGRLLAHQAAPLSDYIIKSANYTVLNSDPRTIYCDTNSASFTLTLTAAPIDGIIREPKNTGGNGNDLIIARNGQTIDGLNEDYILIDKHSIVLQFTTNGWQAR